MRAAGLSGVVLVAALGCAELPSAIPGRPPVDADYRVASPDVLSISVRPPDPPILRDVLVRPDGRISFDLIGDLEVAGKTVSLIQREIEARLGEFLVHPEVTVLLAASNSRQFYIWGEVGRPGSYPIVGDITVAEALAIANGPSRFASLSSCRLVRPTGDVPLNYVVDLEAITLRGDGTTNYELQDGDIVYVPANLWGRMGYALGVLFFPFQQIFGFGRQVVVTTYGGS